MIIFFILNQLYGVIIRINKKLIQISLNKIFNIYYGKVSQLVAASKIFIMHIQILNAVASNKINLIQDFLLSFQFFGNPQSGIIRNLECLIKVETQEQQKNLSLTLSYYALLIIIGSILLMVICEIILFQFKKFIK